MTKPSDARVEARQCWVFCLDFDCCYFGWGPTIKAAFDDVEDLEEYRDVSYRQELTDQAQRVEAFDGYASRADIPARVLLENDYGVDCSICKNETFSVNEQVYWTLDGKPVCDGCHWVGSPHVTLEVLDQFHAATARAQRAEQDSERLREALSRVLMFPKWLNIGGTETTAEIRLGRQIFEDYRALTAAAEGTNDD